MKTFQAVVATALLALAAIPAFAFTIAPMPVDPSTGAHMADPDEQFDDAAQPGQAAMNFGGALVMFQGQGGAGNLGGVSGDEVQTGEQMHDPATRWR